MDEYITDRFRHHGCDYRQARFSPDSVRDVCLSTPQDGPFLERASGGFDFPGLIESARGRFEKEGYRTEAKTATRMAVNKAFVRFPGLEHEMGLSPRAEKVFSVKIEVDTLKGRDIYDLVWYLSDPTWPEPNEILLANRLRQSAPADIL